MRLTSTSLSLLLRVFALTMVFYGLSVFFVEWFYSKNPPHFDSVGSLTLMYDYMNTLQQESWVSGWRQPWLWCSSWLQSLFPLFAPVLPRTPSAMMLLNFIMLGIAQLSVFDCARSYGASRQHALGLTLLPVLPAMFHGHYSTYQDMNRNGSWIGLQTATYFFSLAYVKSPTPWRGVALGLVAALTQWSRDSSTPFIAIVLMPAVGIALAQAWRTRISLMRLAIFPLTAFTIIALPYGSLCAESNLNRLTQGVYALGASPEQAFKYAWWAPMGLLLGGLGRSFVYRLLLLLVGVPATVYGGAKSLEWDWSWTSVLTASRWWLLVSSAFVCIAVITLAVATGFWTWADWGPLFPSIVGPLGLLMALSFGLTMRLGRVPIRVKRIVLLSAALLFTFASTADALRLASYPSNKQAMTVAWELSRLLESETAGGQRVSFLWDGPLNYWVVNYYRAQAGLPLLQFEAPAGLEKMPEPQSGETVESRLEAIYQSLLSFEILVLSDTPGTYAGRGEFVPTFFNVYGHYVVQRILAHPGYAPIYSFESDGYHFVVLRRKE